jgi:NADH dehydrogenase
MGIFIEFLSQRVKMMDRLVTIFGGGGFIGHYVAQALLLAGARVRIAERHPKNAWRIKGYGNLGQVQFMAADITRPDTVAAAMVGADAVVNLVGILDGDFDTVHVRGAENVAKAARAAGVGSLVHLSAIGADATSASAYGRSKGEGEAAVRAAFPDAVMLRPSIVFGPEDNFINRFAGMAKFPVVPVLRGVVRFQPVYVGDIARAVVAVLTGGACAGRTFELGGPEVLTMRALNERIGAMVGRQPVLVDLPDAVGAAMAKFLGWAPGAPITQDQWQMLQHDNVVADPAAGFATLGIAPVALEAVASRWLVAQRQHGRFAQSKPA